MKRFFVVFLALLLLLPASSFALSQEELMQKIQELSRQLQELKKQMQEMQNQQMQQQADIMDAKDQAKEVKDKLGWLTIGGDYRFRMDSLKGKVHQYLQYDPTNNFGPIPMGPVNMYTFSRGYDGYTAKNDIIMLNRFRLNIKAQATENVAVKARLAMYKVWGHQTSGPLTDNPFFADRYDVGVPFDGQTGHLPTDNKLVVDYAYATWSNIFDLPVWFSVGRRPSTEGIPTNIRQNREKVGTAGVPGLMIDYAFDGLTLGVAPYIEALPGFYAKVCYGKGFDSGFRTDMPGDNTPKDVNFIGVNIVPIDTDTLHVELQWDRAFDIFDTFPDAGVSANLGDIDQYGITATYTLDNFGAGALNLFASAAISKTHPSDELYYMPFYWIDTNGNGIQDASEPTQNAGFGLLYDDPNFGGVKKSRTGSAYYLGARYDIAKTGTKIGLEYNHGSRYWITFGPASDDLWTNKLGTRGDVYEVYLIQELPESPISKFGKAFFRIGYQYYKFDYTGSNSWVGKPKKIEDLNQMNPLATQMFPPLKNAQDIYFTFDVTF